MSTATASLSFKQGDATAISSGILVHVCNDLGAWGKGFVLCVGRAFPEARAAYLAQTTYPLGSCTFVPTRRGILVANLIGQRDIKRHPGQPPPIRYDAVASGLALVAQRALAEGLEVHMPRIGCGLAGGSWDKIEPLVREALVSRGVSVTVWDL